MKKKIKIAIVLTIGFLSFNVVNGQFQNDSTKIVDYHVHIFSPELIVNLAKQGYSFRKAGFHKIKEKEDYSDISEITKDNENAKMVLISAGYAYENIDSDITKKDC